MNKQTVRLLFAMISFLALTTAAKALTQEEVSQLKTEIDRLEGRVLPVCPSSATIESWTGCFADASYQHPGVGGNVANARRIGKFHMGSLKLGVLEIGRETYVGSFHQGNNWLFTKLDEGFAFSGQWSRAGRFTHTDRELTGYGVEVATGLFNSGVKIGNWNKNRLLNESSEGDLSYLSRYTHLVPKSLSIDTKFASAFAKIGVFTLANARALDASPVKNIKPSGSAPNPRFLGSVITTELGTLTVVDEDLPEWRTVQTDKQEQLHVFRGLKLLRSKERSEFVQNVDRIWPYETGKSTSYNYSRGTNTWRISITVKERGQLETPLGSRLVFKIEIEERGLGQNNYVGLETVWVDAIAEVPWKREYKNIRGNPASMKNFTITKIDFIDPTENDIAKIDTQLEPPQANNGDDEGSRFALFEKWQSDEVRRIEGLGKPTTPNPTEAKVDLSELESALIEADRLKQEKAELEAQLTAVQQAQFRPVSPVGPALSVHAIVIGNGAYQGSGRLDNPINDARAISAKLKNMGFKVTTVENADRNKLVSSLVKFSSSAAESDLTLFFYAGHGVQISGTNYMLPTDTNLNQIGGVPLHGISLNSVVDQFLPGKTKLVFLDACRDNPLLQVASRSVSRGLAPISVSQGTLISYATKDGSVAADGEGKNSPFTKALLQHIDSPEDIAVVLRKVRDQVMRDTGGQQQPWEYGSLSGGSLILSAIRAK
jgi:hypothetical protein